MRSPRSLYKLLFGMMIGLVLVSGCDNGAPRPEPREPATADVKALALGSNAFAFDLYDQLRKDNEGNLFFSPYSISTALAMTYAGARGATESQMGDVLHFNLSQERLHAAMGIMARDLDAAGKNRAYQLNIANRLWARSDFEFLAPFLDVTREDYGAQLTRLDFAGNSEESRQTINSWVEEKTNDRIRELLKPGVVNPTTVLVLTNAIYFKGDWAAQFETSDTRETPFRISADETVDVPMMYQNHEFRFAESDAAKIIELPYEGDDLSMLVVLPKEVEGLTAVEDQLNAAILETWLSSLAKQEVDVWLPKFKMTSEFQLNDALAEMGMPLPFSPDADFSGMNGSGGLSISAVVHKAFVDVNEEGTEAAAATAVVMDESAAMSAQFRADHPFIFLIRDNLTGSILFIGRVLNPQA